MPFGNKAGPSVVYCYPAHEPSAGLDVIEEQLHLMHRYRRELVEIETARRARYGDLMRAFQPPEAAGLEADLATVDTEMQTIRDAIAARNAKAKRRVGTPEERARLKALRLRRQELVVAVREIKAKLRDDPTLAAQVEASDAQAFAEIKLKRAKCGLFWPNYLQVEPTVKRSGPPPENQRWTGDGKVSVQVQGGLSMADLYGCQDARIRMPYPELDGKRPARVTVRLRVQSDEHGRPIWADVPVEVSRLPPDDARLKWVFLVRRRHKGTQWQWTLQLVLERAAGWADPHAATSGVVGVDLGWRLLEDRLRVAYWVGDDGREGEIALPLRVVEKWRYAESVQGIRDTRFNHARAALVDWLHLHRETCPDWFRERARGLPQWQSANRLAALVFDWNTQGNEVPGDETILPFLVEWRKQDRHLLRLAESVRQQAVDYRERELFRHAAAPLRRQYRVIAVEGGNIREMLAKPGPEAEESGQAMRLYHRMAAPGRLRQLLLAKAARPLLVDPVEHKPTKTCHGCGSVEEVDGTELFHTCSQCGRTWDIDVNAARNLLRIGCESQDDEPGEDDQSGASEDSDGACDESDAEDRSRDASSDDDGD